MPGRRGVIWDFDGTLAERPGLWSACLLEVIKAYDPEAAIRREDISAYLRTGFPWHTPERAHPELCEPEIWWKEITGLLAGVLRKLGYPPELAAQLRGRYVGDSAAWQVFPDVPAALQRLSKHGYTQLILSNHAPELPVLVDQLGISDYFRSVITSARTGFEKPHPGAYGAAREVFPAGADLWMVGDNEEADVAGAERAGIRGILLQRKEPGCPPKAERCVASAGSAANMILAARSGD